jgi:hypothetical protein
LSNIVVNFDKNRNGNFTITRRKNQPQKNQPRINADARGFYLQILLKPFGFIREIRVYVRLKIKNLNFEFLGGCQIADAAPFEVFKQIDENMRGGVGIFRRAVMIDERDAKIIGDRV